MKARSNLRTFWIFTILPLRHYRYTLGHNSQLKELVIIATNCKNFGHGSEAFNDCADFLERWEKEMQLYTKKEGIEQTEQSHIDTHTSGSGHRGSDSLATSAGFITWILTS